jgi:NADH-quinone oxidoreductase subunit H
VRFTGTQWLLLVYPIGFVAALISLMGKLELQPFDAPEAETEIVAGALTEYSGRGLALFRLAKGAELVLGLALIAAFYLGSVGTLAAFALKTGALLLLITGVQALMARLRIDQTVGLWWRYGILLVLVQWAGMILLEVLLSM